MVILGLVLLLAGAVLLVLGLFTSEVKIEDSNDTTVTIANVDLSAEALFLVGVAAATLILVGLSAIKIGAKQGWRHRREQKRLYELSEKLERAEADRRRGDDDEGTTA